MLVEVKVPQLAESVTEATLLDWHKQQGEGVARGDNLIDIETDKVVLEVTAADNGVLKEIRKNSGDDVASNEVIAIIDTQAGAATAQSDGKAAVSRNAQPGSEPQVTRRPEAQASAAPESAQRQPPREPDDLAARREGASSPDQAQTVTGAGPAVRKLLEEHRIDAREIAGSGKNGRITKADIIAHLESEPVAENDLQEARAPAAPAEMSNAAARPERRVAMTRLRKRVAERLLQAQRDNAILTTFNEVDMHPVMSLRKRYREHFEKVHGVRLGFMGFFVMAAIEALKRFPLVNASIDGGDIIYHSYFDVGIAVSSPRGLVVPILRDAHCLSMAEIEKAVADCGRKAKDNTLTLDDLTGGTFTITNGGVFGSLLSTPILNPPQSAILGMHKVEDRPIARDGEVLIRPMMYLALSYDHRIIDGREAVQFLVTIKEQIEDPHRLLLQI